MIKLKQLNISIVSPKDILKWSSRIILGIIYIGEIYLSKTINYNSGFPVLGGLFCEKIFGPIISWKCLCNNIIKKNKYICSFCGSEINSYKIRKFRMGIINLKTPIFHPWYFNNKLSILPILTNSTFEIFNNLIYYKYCKNIKIYNSNIYKNIKKLHIIQLIYINIFIQKYLQIFNIIENIIILKELLLTNKKINNIIFYKKLFFLNIFFFNNLNLSWLLLDNFPVIPPDLRPIIKLNKNNFIISNINNLYKNILIHNNRLKKFLILQKKIPLIFEINEKIQLQKSIDNIFNKNKKYKNLNLILKSLTSKYGRFRQNLLGKRIDYSSRSVIISGSDLTFSKVGIPISIACNLFLPMLIRILKKYKTIKYIISNSNYIYTSIIFRRLITRIFKTNILLINRAPTLHRINIQGFKPYLIEGQSIKIYPLVCSSFNADFDGDQMSILLNITKPSRLETKYILSSDKNFLSPSTGFNLFKLNQIFLLGLFFINTIYYKKYVNIYIYFNTIEDLLIFYSMGIIDLHTLVWVKLRYIKINSNIIKNSFYFSNVGRFILLKLISII